jgi:glutathione synthase
LWLIGFDACASYPINTYRKNCTSFVNSPNEKLSILEFPEFIPTTLVSADPAEIIAFWQAQGDVVVKPLNGMGGSGIFRLRADEINVNAILESFQGSAIMAQSFLPAIAEGDKRVLVLGGMVQSHTLARIPKMGETRGNLAAGGKAVAMPITPQERHIAEALAPLLLARGLIIVGLDMIGGRLTEMNVTSPTCMVEIEAQTGVPIAEHALDAISA